MAVNWRLERVLTKDHYHNGTSLGWIQLRNATMTTHLNNDSWLEFCAGVWSLGALTFNLSWNSCLNKRWILGRDIRRRLIRYFTFCGTIPRKVSWWTLLIQWYMKVYFILMLIGRKFIRTWWSRIHHEYQSLLMSLYEHILLLILTMLQMLSLGYHIQVYYCLFAMG